MGKKKFTLDERYAVFTIHGEKCYMCEIPLDLKSMEVDHIIPENLLDEKTKLKSALTSFGLPPDFDLNSFSNWLPSCRKCNNTKRAILFKPSPIIQVYLQKAIEKSSATKKLSQKIISKRDISKALSTLERAKSNNLLDQKTKEELLTLAEFHDKVRSPELKEEPFKLTPLYEILKEYDGYRIIKGPYGIGGGPTLENLSSNIKCSSCGSVNAFNGTRCVICGEMED